MPVNWIKNFRINPRQLGTTNEMPKKFKKHQKTILDLKEIAEENGNILYQTD